ncbi:MAG: tetratricopeptide repeat protein [Chloroflexota bacterium]|nr:tetratricopeptide repeat protein [Chloroflexota bacterium]
MNASSRRILSIAAVAVLLTVSALVLPTVASALFLNSADRAIARARALPADAPARAAALDDATARLTEARVWSDSPRVTLGQARVFLARGEPQRAADMLPSRGVALQSDSIAQFLWAEAAWQLNQPTVAYEHWRAAGAREYFTQQMHRAADDHAWREAVELARIAAGIDPEDADAHYVLGDALSHLSIDDPEALAELERAAEMTRDPEFRSAVLSRQGEILASQGKLSHALARFDQARRVAPTDARPRTGYALALLEQQPDARDQAVALLTQVVGDSPWYTAAYSALAGIFQARGDLQGAEAWLQKGLARNPNNPDLLFALGRLYLSQQRWDEAKSALTLALRNETRADNLQAIARVYARLNGP